MVVSLEKVLIYFFLVVVLVTGLGEGQNECNVSRCGSFGPDIFFPFRLNSQPDSCGYHGFNLSCTDRNETMLQLPNLVKFFVKSIDYKSQVIQLSDPENCLPRQLRQIELSSSPFLFQKEYRFDFALYSCYPAERESIYGYLISCLSDNSHKVYSFDSRDIADLPIASCTKMYNLLSCPVIPGHDDVLELKWLTPACGHCAEKGRKCRLKINGIESETECFAKHNKGAVLGSFLLLLGVFALYRVYRFDKLERENQVGIERFLEDYINLEPTRYSYADLKRITKQFAEKLGQGAYGTIFKGKLSNEIHVAVKILNSSKGNGDEFLNEVGTMGRIHHVNVVRLVGFCADGFRRALVYEFLPNDSLKKFISLADAKNSFLGWEKLRDIALGIAKGIEYLHQGWDQRILYFDIKPRNALLDQNFNPKISDFGLAKLCAKDQSAVSMTTARGTMGYIAPEVFSRNFRNVSYKADVYSFEMLLLETVGGRKNVKVTNENNSHIYFPKWIYNLLEQKEDLRILIEDDEDAKFVKKLAIVGFWCIQWHPVDRPSMKTVVQMLEGERDDLTMPPNPFASTRTTRAPSTPSAPPPSPPSSPPPSTPSATPPKASPSPPSTPTSSPPPSTPASSPPPPSSTPSPPATRSPPPPSSSRDTPTVRSPPPPPTNSSSSPDSSSNGISSGVVVGIAIGGVVILVVLSILCVCCTKKKRRRRDEEAYYPPPPPPPPPGPKNGPYGGAPQHWQQHNAPPPADHVVGAFPKPSPPPAVASRPPHSSTSSLMTPKAPPPPPFLSSSGGSGSNYSGSENPLPPPHRGMALGFSKSTFTYEELAMATDGFSDANLLGQGGFGYVHRGVLPNGKEVAIKQLKAGSGQGEREFQAEVEIISRVHHKHLVSLVGYCMTGSQRLLVYEFVPNNTLEFHLHGKGRPTMDWATRLKIALGSAKGLAYLHEDCHPRIIHRDIKAANILLDFKFEAKVADFGLAKFSSDANTHVSTRVMGTFGYLAPEYASSGKLTDKSDVFSYGVMLLELITGHRPVDTTHMEESLVEWARPLLTRALEERNFDALVDPRLKNDYEPNEMASMVACAAACVRHSARRRPRLSQIVRALEGDASLADLNEGIRPVHGTAYSSHESSDYDTSQYNEDMKKFRKMALGSQEYGASSEYSGPTSEYGLYPSGSSSEGQNTREIETGKMKKSSQVFSGRS